MFIHITAYLLSTRNMYKALQAPQSSTKILFHVMGCWHQLASYGYLDWQNCDLQWLNKQEFSMDLDLKAHEM